MNSGNPPFVSIVIPAYNAGKTIEECLRSVRALEYPADRHEVILVDNGSRDATAQIARDLGFPPLACEKRGASAARNRGARQAKGEILAFTDSDAVVAPDWLARLVEPFDSAEIAGAGGLILPWRVKTGAEAHATFIRVLDQERFLAGRPPYMPPFVATVNAAYRARAFFEIGGFDEALSICEDADLAWRAQWAGGRLAFAREARVWHHHRPDRKSYFRQVFAYGCGTVRLFAKHRERLGRRTWIDLRHLWAIVEAAAKVPFSPVFGKNSWERVAPCYDLAAHVCYLAGRVSEAVRRRVIVL